MNNNQIPKRDAARLITPKLAAKWLACNRDSNRNISDSIARNYANEIKAGQWLDCHQPIAFSTDGRLLDGQHRLSAIILADIATTMRVAVNCDPATFAVIDTGRVRTGGDIMTIAGFKHGRLLAAIASWELVYQDGRKSKSRRIGQNLLRLAESDPDLVDAAATAVQYNNDLIKLFPVSIAAFIFYKTYKKKPRKALDFLHGFATGEDLQSGDPRLILRTRMQKIRADPTMKVAVFIKAWLGVYTWNAYIKNQSLKKIAYNGSLELPRFAF